MFWALAPGPNCGVAGMNVDDPVPSGSGSDEICGSLPGCVSADVQWRPSGKGVSCQCSPGGSRLLATASLRTLGGGAGGLSVMAAASACGWAAGDVAAGDSMVCGLTCGRGRGWACACAFWPGRKSVRASASIDHPGWRSDAALDGTAITSLAVSPQNFRSSSVGGSKKRLWLPAITPPHTK